MKSKWEPVVDLLTHMADDDDLLLRWGLIEAGDVRSKAGREHLIHMKRGDLLRLTLAVAQRITEDAS